MVASSHMKRAALLFGTAYLHTLQYIREIGKTCNHLHVRKEEERYWKVDEKLDEMNIE